MPGALTGSTGARGGVEDLPVRFDKNRYSVSAGAVGRPVEIRAYADWIELRQDGRVVGKPSPLFWA